MSTIFQFHNAKYWKNLVQNYKPFLLLFKALKKGNKKIFGHHKNIRYRYLNDILKKHQKMTLMRTIENRTKHL